MLENEDFIGSLLGDYMVKLESKVTAFVEEAKVSVIQPNLEAIGKEFPNVQNCRR